MTPNNRPSERAGIVGVISPDVHAPGARSTAWIHAGKAAKYMAVIFAGTLGAGATLDAKLEQATDAAGAGAKDIAGKAITQLVKATDDDKQAIINLNQDQLDINAGYTHFRLVETVAGANSDVGGVVLSFDQRQGPASDGDLASVKQIVG